MPEFNPHQWFLVCYQLLIPFRVAIKWYWAYGALWAYQSYLLKGDGVLMGRTSKVHDHCCEVKLASYICDLLTATSIVYCVLLTLISWEIDVTSWIFNRTPYIFGQTSYLNPLATKIVLKTYLLYANTMIMALIYSCI